MILIYFAENNTQAHILISSYNKSVKIKKKNKTYVHVISVNLKAI